MPMGYAFQPGADQPMQSRSGQGGRSLPPPASSVKMLSFRMPKQDVRGSIAPSALLNAPGGGGAGTGGLSPQLLALLLSAFSADPQAGASQGPFTGSSDPAGVVGPSLGNRSLTPRFTIGDEGDPFRLGDDMGAGIAAGGARSEIPQGGMRGSGQPTSGVGGPQYRMLDDSLSLPYGQPFDQGMGRMFF